MTDLIGQSFGRYKILEPLGAGGMATVYKALDTRLDRSVAIKMIRVGAFPPDQVTELFKRFEREAKSLGKLLHPNIVSVIDYGEEQGVPYLVMVYLPGGTLKKMMGKPMHWREAARLLIPVARALQFAHQQGIIHRDIKPSNILITLSGEPMLSDFGIAKILEVAETTQLTGTGAGIGTPEYMSPEQGLGKAIDGRADLYSLGIVFYELITGRKPFTADTPMSIIFKHVTDPLPLPGLFVPGIPGAVENLLVKALAKAPDNRYHDMGAFADALEELVRSQAAPAIESPTTNLQNPSPASTLKFEPVNTPTMLVEPEEKQRAVNRTVSTFSKEEKEKAKGSPIMATSLIAGMSLIACLLIGVIIYGVINLLPQQSPAVSEPSAVAAAPALVFPSATNLSPVQEIQPQITNTAMMNIIPTLTIPAMPTAAEEEAASCQVELCDFSFENVCVYSFAPQSTSLIVALKFKENLDPANLPLLTIKGKSFKCEVINTYPDRLYCSGSTATGYSEVEIFTSQNKSFCSGSLVIPAYIPPSPTPRKPKGNYP